MPGAVFCTLLVVGGWGYFIWTGDIATIWPMFGIANQLLASVALAVATTILINLGRYRYIWVTLIPLSFLSVTTLTAGWLTVKDNFWPMATGPDPALHVQGYINSFCTLTMMVLVVIILGAAVRKWVAVGKTGIDPDLVAARAVPSS
jgi:carbon starvation protein